MSKSIIRISTALTLLLAMQAAQAQTFSGTSTGTTTWSSVTGWSAVPVSGSSTALTFGTVDLASGVAVVTTQDIASPPFLLNSLTINYGAPGVSVQPTLTISGSQLNFVSNGGTTPAVVLNTTGPSSTLRPQLFLSAAVLLSNNTDIGGASDALITGAITNANSAVITKSGAGTLRIESSNTAYTGNFTVTGGLLQIGNNGSGGDIGSGTINLAGGNVTVRKSGNLTLNNTITGTGNFTVQTRTNAVITINKANSYTGTTTLSPTAADQVGTMRLGLSDALSTTSVLSITNTGNSVQTFDLNNFNQTLGGLATSGGSASATNSKVTLGSGTLTINDGSARTYAGEITGTGNVVKQGAGTWTLASANGYTGTTTISAGGITLGTGTTGAINTSSRINVAGGATFTNNTTTAVTAPALSLTEGAILAGTGTFTPGNLFVGADLSNGFTAITAGTALTKAGTLTFEFTNITAGNYSLFSGTPGGTFSGLSIGASALSTANAGATFTGTVGAFSYIFTNSSNQINISAIPEPASSAALFGLGVLGLIAVRRRRRN